MLCVVLVWQQDFSGAICIGFISVEFEFWFVIGSNQGLDWVCCNGLHKRFAGVSFYTRLL